MTFNLNHAELVSRDLRIIRLKEGDQKRLIKSFTLAHPSLIRKIWLISLDHWQSFWSWQLNRERYLPMTRTEGKTHNL